MQVVETDPSVVPRYRTYIPTMCKLLRQLLQTGMSPEHDIGGITNPFLQVRGALLSGLVLHAVHMWFTPLVECMSTTTTTSAL